MQITPNDDLGAFRHNQLLSERLKGDSRLQEVASIGVEKLRLGRRFAKPERRLRQRAGAAQGEISVEQTGHRRERWQGQEVSAGNFAIQLAVGRQATAGIAPLGKTLVGPG